MLTWYVDCFVTMKENAIRRSENTKSLSTETSRFSPCKDGRHIGHPGPSLLIVCVRRSTLALVVRRQLSDWDALNDLPQLAYALVGLQLWYVPHFHNHWYISSIYSRPHVRVCISIV